jgi:hypothetical protein
MSPAARAQAVDLALVLAVDVSQSMDPDEQRLQRDGYVEAFQSEIVSDAISRGALGRIAVVYFEWSAANEQQVIVPWTVVRDGEDAAVIADRLAQEPIHRMSSTSVSGAVDFGIKLLADGGFSAERLVIDVSGDGPNNHGRPLAQARDEALARGITINGLPIMLNEPSGSADIPNLDLYFRDCVIGGPGAFMIPVRERDEFGRAIRAKLVLEVSGHPATPALMPAQETERVDCYAVELRQ